MRMCRTPSIRERDLGAFVCCLAVVVVMLLALAGVAVAAVAGRTSQGLPISFRLSRGHLTNLKFEIKAVCPSGRVWRVDASGFPAIKIVRSRFDAAFGSRKPSARATVKGKVGAKKVTGSLTMKRFIAQEGHYCRGSSSFTVRR
jgi:hypothetical protein